MGVSSTNSCQRRPLTGSACNSAAVTVVVTAGVTGSMPCGAFGTYLYACSAMCNVVCRMPATAALMGTFRYSPVKATVSEFSLGSVAFRAGDSMGGITCGRTGNGCPFIESICNGSAASVAVITGDSVEGIPPKTSTSRSPRRVSVRSGSTAKAVSPTGKATGSRSGRSMLRNAARRDSGESGSNFIAVCNRASWPAVTRMPTRRPWPSWGLSASSVYSPAASPINL